ncbi:hypothetical protein PAEPH01_0984, partial [Pancytospora epiphaga]
MDRYAKPISHGAWGIIKLALVNFGQEHPYRKLYIAMIIFLTLGRNLVYGLEYIIEERLTSARNIMYSTLIVLLFLKIIYYGMHFVKYFLFEKHLAKFGPRFSSTIMKNLLFSDGNKVLEMSGGQIEYYVTEGSKAIAKISRQMIMGFFSKVVYLFIDLACVFHKDKSKDKIVFILTLMFSVLITFVKAYYVNRAIYHLKSASNAGFERERVYTEAIDNLSIIKSFRTEEQTIAKYKRKTKTWSLAQFHFKYHLFFGNMVYDFLGILFRMCSTMYYLNLHPESQAKDVYAVLRLSAHLLATGTALIGLHQDVEESLAAAYCILEYLVMAQEDINSKFRINMFNESIEVRNLTYSARGKVIFSDVNFVLNRGDKAALIGRNGVGKSSIFKLLLNFDDFQGEILIDGVDIRGLAMIDYRSLITFVPQDTRLFDESIYANLCFGNNRSYSDIVAEC